MPEPVHVPDIPGSRERLCWEQDPVTFARCDRAQHHAGLHTWEWAAITTALNCETVEGALHHIGALKQTLAKAEAELAALRAKTCDRCVNSEIHLTTNYCALTRADEYGFRTPCEDLGNTCGAWTAKETP